MQSNEVATQGYLFCGWHIDKLQYYLLRCVICACIVRIVLCFFKAWSISRQGESIRPGRIGEHAWWYWFLQALRGFGAPDYVDDYFLPMVIGFMELCSYPVLLRLNHISVIGGWLVIKTAGQWRVWTRSRTSFNRYLVGNLLNLGLSFFWLSRFVKT